MKIRKEFRVESAHIVRNCSSERCKGSQHGHSAVIEVFLESSDLDNAEMVYDFGLMKGSIKQFIDSMDHCYLLCEKDNGEFKDFVKKYNSRWIEFPFNPSAEMLSMYVMVGVNKILDNTRFANGESCDVICTGVRYHETTTGWAECCGLDIEHIWNEKYDLSDVTYSEDVYKDWGEDLKQLMMNNKMIHNPVVEQQIKLK